MLYHLRIFECILSANINTGGNMHNAASIAAMFLTSEVAVAIIPEKETPAMAGQGMY